MQQAGCKLEEDVRAEIIMLCYVKARQPDMVLATLQDFIDGGGQVSGSRVLADAEQVGLVDSRAKRLPCALPGMCTPTCCCARATSSAWRRCQASKVLRPAIHLFAPALAITALALLAMCRTCICLCGAHSLDSTCLSLMQAFHFLEESSAVELHRAVKGVCTRWRALHGLGRSAGAAPELQLYARRSSQQSCRA